MLSFAIQIGNVYSRVDDCHQDAVTVHSAAFQLVDAKQGLDILLVANRGRIKAGEAGCDQYVAEDADDRWVLPERAESPLIDLAAHDVGGVLGGRVDGDRHTNVAGIARTGARHQCGQAYRGVARVEGDTLDPRRD